MKKCKYYIELRYFGKKYHGWQIQPNANTIQGELNSALSKLQQEEIETIGAGRTDTGVHANYFVAHFETINRIPDVDKIVYNLNGILSPDITVSKIKLVPNEYHARFDAVSRTYKYFISKQKSPFKQDTSHLIYGNLQVSKMNEAAKLLFNYKDFTSFSKLHTDVKTNNCTIKLANWQMTDSQLIFTIKADRFLRNMVRSIVGTMIEIGFGKMTLDEFKAIIEAKDRGEAGPSAPAKGLFLWDIEYPYEF